VRCPQRIAEALKLNNHGLLEWSRITERSLAAWLFRLPAKTNFSPENVRGHCATIAKAREPAFLKNPKASSRHAAVA
jgi:hypothetical protein